MELVYLWVEDYKNIHKQGFNFSPRFECDYDGTNLTIKPKEHIQNFFDGKGKINITTIVGKNGSGKSSVYKILLFLFAYYNFQNSNSKSKEPKIEKLTSAFFVFVDKDGNKKYITYKIDVKTDIKKFTGNLDFYTIYFNYMLDTLKDTREESFIDECYHKSDGYKTPLLIEPNKKGENIDLKSIEYLTKYRFANVFSKNKRNQFIEKFFNPTHIEITINNNKIFRKLENLIKKDDSFFGILARMQITKKNLLYVALKIVEKDYSINVKKLLENEINNLKRVKSFYNNVNVFDKLINIIEQKSVEIKKYFDNAIAMPIYEKSKIITAISFDSNTQTTIEDTQYIKVLLDDNIKKILPKIPSWIDIEYYENDKSYSSLSGGQKAFFSFMMGLIYHFANLEDKYKNDDDYNTINLFLDETELGFHPEWQKKYLEQIILALKNFDIQLNLVIATHSPFLLSDLPKENVIFLDTDETGNCKVVDGLKDKKQTFGANIHTLLSDSFFMDDGLMGEFAKGKIDEVITLLNKEHLDKDELSFCEQIISIIGEPIIKHQLQRMLDSKRLKKVDKIDKMEQDIINLQKKLEEIKK